MKRWIQSLVDSFRLYFGQSYYHLMPYWWSDHVNPKTKIIEGLKFRFAFTIPFKTPMLTPAGKIVMEYHNLHQFDQFGRPKNNQVLRRENFPDLKSYVEELQRIMGA